MKKFILLFVFFSNGIFGVDTKDIITKITDIVGPKYCAVLVDLYLRTLPAGGPRNDERWRIHNENSIINIYDQESIRRGKVFLLENLLGVILNLPREKIIKMRDKKKIVDFGRYKPNEREVAQFVYDIANPAISRIVASKIVYESDRMMMSSQTKRNIGIYALDCAVQEGLYRLICAEVHKHESLACMRRFFPASNDPKKESMLQNLVCLGYNFVGYDYAKNCIKSLLPKNNLYNF